MKTIDRYWKTVIQRENVLGAAIGVLFLSMASYVRLTLEVFIRKNMGLRYINLASVITVGVILFVVPSIIHTAFGSARYGTFWKWENIKEGFITWYIFLGLFLYFSFLRLREIKKGPSPFQFGRFSKSSGDLDPFFFKLSLTGKKITSRQVEIFYEPVCFFILGLILWKLGEYTGIMLMMTSFAYSQSYAAAYRKGDNFILDMIDKWILNQDKETAFMEDDHVNNARGVRFRMEKPSEGELRKKYAKLFDDDEESTAS